MQLLGNRLLVRPIPHPTKTAGGLELPDSAKPRYSRSTVVQVGQGDSDKPLDLKAGMVVLHFPQGTDLEFGGEKLKLIQESDLFAVE